MAKRSDPRKGLSPGPKTEEGKAKALANLKPRQLTEEDRAKGRATKAVTPYSRYAKAFGETGLAGLVHEQRTDPELKTLNKEIELTQAFIEKSLQDFSIANCEAAWDSLYTLYKQFWNSTKEEQLECAREAFNIVRDGVDEWRKIGTAMGYVEVKRKLIDTESKRLKDMNVLITPTQVELIITGLLNSVEAHVKDPETRASIGRDFSRIMFANNRRAANESAD